MFMLLSSPSLLILVPPAEVSVAPGQDIAPLQSELLDPNHPVHHRDAPAPPELYHDDVLPLPVHTRYLVVGLAHQVLAYASLEPHGAATVDEVPVDAEALTDGVAPADAGTPAGDDVLTHCESPADADVPADDAAPPDAVAPAATGAAEAAAAGVAAEAAAGAAVAVEVPADDDAPVDAEAPAEVVADSEPPVLVAASFPP
ncbi:hypothetical protein DFH29DRAFT_879564 [Suillus ampliporus]|nr:hypothetical protein DFH29DRAFT_879564 [Suillus ampliporus]